MKKLINEPDNVVDQMLEGITAGSDLVNFVPAERVVVRADLEDFRTSGKVALISGGGAGHEPAHAGYVGQGMLTAAVSGSIFASPSVDQILAAIRMCAADAGVLLIVKSYTGDRLNFGLAAELARTEGFLVEMVVVGDDVALGTDQHHAGRRGLAGTVFVHKVAGAAAERGLPLVEVKAIAEEVSSGLATMSVGLGACVVPGEKEASFVLADHEVEWGLGIHGEAGVERGELVTASEAAGRLVAETLRVASKESSDLQSAPANVAVMVNNLGGTSNVEMGIMGGDVLKEARRLGATVQRFWSGAFMTALEMPGVSVTFLRLREAISGTIPDLLDLLDAPAKTIAWPAPWVGKLQDSQVLPPREVESGFALRPPSSEDEGKLDESGVQLLQAVSETLVTAENELTRMDRVVGDGDLGQSLAHAAKTIDALIEDLPRDPAESLTRIAGAIRKAVGGTSGPLYSIGLLRAAHQLREALQSDAIKGAKASESPGSSKTSSGLWASAFEAGVSAIEELGGARVGDCTMIDALRPAADALIKAAEQGADLKEALNRASAEAKRGAESTRELRARKGRASYVGARAVGEMDPGAWAVYLWLETLAQTTQE